VIDLSTATFIGPESTDPHILELLPKYHRDLLLAVNGCILFGGGLHIRGICADPDWHSLQRVWSGVDALSLLYPAVRSADVPFAEDFLGNQFLLREDGVHRLEGETGELLDLQTDFQGFLRAAQANPPEYLSLSLLERYESQGNVLQPGQLLNVYPPLATSESANGVSLRAVPTLECIRFLADFASQIADVLSGGKIRLRGQP